MNILLGIVLTIFILLEGTITTLPLVLVFLLCLTIVKRDAVVFPIAFVTGLFLDLLTVHTVGEKSIFFVVFVFLVLLYQRKYEINSYPFVAFSAFLGAFFYSWVFGAGNIFILAFISSMCAILLFKVVSLQFSPRGEAGKVQSASWRTKFKVIE